MQNAAWYGPQVYRAFPLQMRQTRLSSVAPLSLSSTRYLVGGNVESFLAGLASPQTGLGHVGPLEFQAPGLPSRLPSVCVLCLK